MKTNEKLTKMQKIKIKKETLGDAFTSKSIAKSHCKLKEKKFTLPAKFKSKLSFKHKQIKNGKNDLK